MAIYQWWVDPTAVCWPGALCGFVVDSIEARMEDYDGRGLLFGDGRAVNGRMDGWMDRLKRRRAWSWFHIRNPVSNPDSQQTELFRRDKSNRGKLQGSKCQTG
jgi:hypothetical protein